MATVADAWRPTSELEHRLQETVRAGDQESYFRLLADSELVIPVPPDLVDGVLAGEAQPSWPTQEEDGRVHVLVYTSAAAMRACLGPAYQHFMTVRFGDIAEGWPDNRWWLAVDAPARGVAAALPIEARLPAWFVRQVAEGDGRPPLVGRATPPWEELRDQHRDLPREAPRPEFQPANDVERELLRAAANNDHDLFLQTLAATDVLLPVPDETDYSLRPGRPGFPWQTREVDGSTVVPVFTSPERLAEASGPGTEHITLPFTVVLRYWPNHDWALAINSGSPAGGTVLAQQLPGLATWADRRAAQRMTERFEPQNDIEQRLFDAGRRGDTESFFKILLGAQVLVPVDAETPWGIVPGDGEFPWRPVPVHGRTSIQIFTSLKWMNEAIGSSRFIMPSLLEMVTAWPDASWTLVLNPGTPIDASMPGEQVRTLSGPPAPPSAAAPPAPAAPAVPVAPAVPADPPQAGEPGRHHADAPAAPPAPAAGAAGPGRHASAAPTDEPAVPAPGAPAEAGRHHAGPGPVAHPDPAAGPGPSGPAEPGRPEIAPQAPAHFGELGAAPGEAGRHHSAGPAMPHAASAGGNDTTGPGAPETGAPGVPPQPASSGADTPVPPDAAGGVPANEPPSPAPGLPGGAGRHSDPSSTAIDPALLAGLDPAAAPGPTGQAGGVIEPGPPGSAPRDVELPGRHHAGAPGSTDRPGIGAEPGLPEPAPQADEPLGPGAPGDAGRHLAGTPGTPADAITPETPASGVPEPGLPGPAPQANEPLGPGAPADAGRHLAGAPRTPADATAPEVPAPASGALEPGLPGATPQANEPLGPGAPGDAGRHLAGAPGTPADAITPETPASGAPEPGLPGPAPQSNEPLGPSAPADAGHHLAGASGSPLSAATPGPAPQEVDPSGPVPDGAGRAYAAPPGPGADPGHMAGRDDPGAPRETAPGGAGEVGGPATAGVGPRVPEEADRRVAGPGEPRDAALPGQASGRDATDQGAPSATGGLMETGPQVNEPPTPEDVERHQAGMPGTPPQDAADTAQSGRHDFADHAAPGEGANASPAVGAAEPGGPAAVQPTAGPAPQDAALPGQADGRDVTGPGRVEDGGSAAPAGEAASGRALHAVGEPEPAFEPGNRIDQELYEAAASGDSDAFLRVLLNANVLVPIPDDAPLEVTPVQREFRWDAALRDAVSVQVFTSLVRLREVLPESRFVYADFRELIGAWPREDWAMVLNPGTHIGASLHGDQVRSLSEWAVRVGLVPGRPEVPLPPPRREPVPQMPAADPEDRVSSPTIMQKVVPHGHVSWYLEQGYDRVGGFVHSTADVAELQTPGQLYEALGLLYADSPFSLDDEGVYVVRWPAYCPDLYRVPFGGRDEEEMASWGEAGWVVERPPFVGSGFAPGSAGSIREYKVASVRLPYGAEMYYLGRDRSERFIAMYDPDRLAWLRPDANADAWDGRTEAAQ
ncbi:SseB family protein [Actinomadura sp. K4S16]|uniref:SseB family protein n=1 Tax=Actinomadura sp. K4S16 TaxID=1316147 RepID=UPI00135CD62A|nr:SseB family protein [Actinomadura sp. K4S16]